MRSKFTKGIRTIRIPATVGSIDRWLNGALLFDLREDPHQQNPLADGGVEIRMVGRFVEFKGSNEAVAMGSFVAWGYR